MAWYDQVHSVQKYRLGTRKVDVAGKMYVYLKGVSSLVAEDLVIYDDAYTAVRAVDGGDKSGPCAVAMAAVDAATEYGWFQIYGPGTVDCADTVAADKQLYLTSTAGRVDDADNAGDAIIGMMSTAAGSSNSLAVWLNFPFVNAGAAFD